MSKYKFKIKTIMMALLALVVIVVSGIFLYFQYKLNSEFAIVKTQNDFYTIMTKNINEIEAYDSSSIEFINIVEKVKNIETNIEFQTPHPLLPIVTNYISHANHIYAIYLGIYDDSFYIVYNLDVSNKMRESQNSPKNARWLVKKHKKENNKVVSFKQFLDKNLNVLLEKKEYTTFLGTQRPWYKKAIITDEIIKTKPYTFSAIQETGVTYAKKIDEQKRIVLSVDITIESLKELFLKQKLLEGSAIFLHDTEGNVIVSRDEISSENVSNINESFKGLFIENKKLKDLNEQKIVKINNKSYNKYTTKLNSFVDSDNYLSFLFPLEPNLEPYKEQIINSLLANIALLVLFLIPLVYYSVERIARPIRELEIENQKVSEGKFDEVKEVNSFMSEISDLSTSFVSMSKSIQEKTKNNEKLIDIGYAMSTIKDYNVILETILIGAKDITGADGGTLYLYNKENDSLDFKIALNSSLNIHIGGTKKEATWPPIKIYDESNNLNKKNISVISAMEDRVILLNDVYVSNEFDFSGVKQFDKANNYKTSSMLVVPIKDREGELLAVIQLINKIKDGEQSTFNHHDKALLKSMAELSSMTLDNNKLILDLENLLYALVESIGSALGEKSKYTGKHVDNVAALSMVIANAINEDNTIYKDIKFTTEELEEIKLAAWLHDIGKITSPEYVIDKGTRLETIYDRVHILEARFEIAKRDIQIEFFENKIDEDDMKKKISHLEKELDFIKTINIGAKFTTPEDQQRLKDISNENTILINNQESPLITEDEHYNLQIKKGTLTDEERDIINNHVIMSYTMLKKVPFPKRFKNVPKLAGSHHKTVDGKGYAHEELINLEMTVGDKILALADIFEALGSHDRPYRKPNTLNQISNILKFMVQDKHLDKDIVKFFLEQKVYEEFTKENFLKDQIDKVDIDFEEIDYK